MKGARLTEREKAVIDTLAGKVPIDVIQALTGRPITTIRSRARAINKSLEYFGKGGNAATGRKRNDLKLISRAKTLLNQQMRPVDVRRETGLASGVISRIASGHIHKDVEPQLVTKQGKNEDLISEVFR
ncbi:VHS1038 protein [Vibrio phage 1]|nr:VHS1038 protein [Vibrio phage 1]